MARIVHNAPGKNEIHTGVEKVVLYPKNGAAYGTGVAWDGITKIEPKGEGGDTTQLYADNRLYASISGSEKTTVSIEAYTTPEEFDACSGYASLAAGVKLNQQPRIPFGLSWVSQVITDSGKTDILHLLYGITVKPVSRPYQTINESVEASTLSFEGDTVPVSVTGKNPTSHMMINLGTVNTMIRKKLEDALYGTPSTDPKFLTPDEVTRLIAS